MHYVLTRSEVPQGSKRDISAILGAEAPYVQRVFQRHHVPVSSLIPSKDASRFAGIEEALISSDVVGRMREDLNALGYNLRGPFESWDRAYEFWNTGQ